MGWEHSEGSINAMKYKGFRVTKEPDIRGNDGYCYRMEDEETGYLAYGWLQNHASYEMMLDTLWGFVIEQRRESMNEEPESYDSFKKRKFHKYKEKARNLFKCIDDLSLSDRDKLKLKDDIIWLLITE